MAVFQTRTACSLFIMRHKSAHGYIARVRFFFTHNALRNRLLAAQRTAFHAVFFVPALYHVPTDACPVNLRSGLSVMVTYNSAYMKWSDIVVTYSSSLEDHESHGEEKTG